MQNMSYILSLFQNSIQMSIFNYVKTNNPIINSIFTTIALVLINYLVKVLQDCSLNDSNLRNIFVWNSNLKHFFYKKNMIVLEGKKSTYSSGYEKNLFVSSLYSDRFNAIWNYIIKNIENTTSIYEIKEIGGASLGWGETKGLQDYQKELFLVIQKNEFLIDKKLKIYAIAENYTESHEDKESATSKNPVKIDKFEIKLFSFETNLNNIKKFIDEITDQYLRTIESERFNKKFIYTLVKTKYEENKHECWSECEFQSSKTFDNLFFKGKIEIINKLDFFINNKKWYYDMGIPYTIGIGLHGPPGTGKTSLIKCIANMLNRHVINLSLKLIKTKRQLDEFFFENRYNNANKKGSIDFNEKIIVFEDIDCIGDIVLKRDLLHDKDKTSNASNGTNKNKSGLDLNKLTISSNINVGEALKSLTNQKNDETLQITKLLNEDDLITLDDILNLWDGLRETPGRVLIITSNCYKELDPALIRPGRIDVTLELGNPDSEIISQLYKHLTKQKIPANVLKKIKPNFYSQAEIINMYLSSNKNPKDFIDRMLLNTKC